MPQPKRQARGKLRVVLPPEQWLTGRRFSPAVMLDSALGGLLREVALCPKMLCQIYGKGRCRRLLSPWLGWGLSTLWPCRTILKTVLKAPLKRKKMAIYPFQKDYFLEDFQGFEPNLLLQGMFWEDKDWDREPIYNYPYSYLVAGHVLRGWVPCAKRRIDRIIVEVWGRGNISWSHTPNIEAKLKDEGRESRRFEIWNLERSCTNEELDFIINYDIKYRMGRESEEKNWFFRQIAWEKLIKKKDLTSVNL